MRSSTQMFIVLGLLVLTASAKQTTFLATDSFAESQARGDVHSFAEIEVQGNPTYTATIYLDEFSDNDESCILTDSQEGKGKGLIFEDYTIDNLCVRLDSDKDVLYLYATEDGEDDIEVIKMGKFSYSYRVKYLTSEERIYIQRTDVNEDSTDGFTLAAQSKFTAASVAAYFTAVDTYDDVADDSGVSKYTLSGYETSWTTIDDDDYELSIKLSTGSSNCITPTDGRLEDIELCIDFSEEYVLDIYANDVFVYRSEDILSDYDKISVTYNGFDNFIYVENSKQTETVFYVPAIDILYIVNEGDLSYGNSGTVSITVDNDDDEDEEGLYDCATFKSSLLEGSALYPTIENMCIDCEVDDSTGTDNYVCVLVFLLEDDGAQYEFANFTLHGDVTNYHQTATVSYDLEEDQFTFSFWTKENYHFGAERTFEFTKYADEIVVWAEDPEYYAPQSLNDNYLLSSLTLAGSGLLDSFQKVPALEFDKYNEGFGIACNEYRCMLGFLREMEFMALKIYSGQFTDYMVYSFQRERGDLDFGEDDMVCLSLANYYENLVINDCGDKDTWMMYQTVIGQYPVWDGTIFETDYEPKSE